GPGRSGELAGAAGESLAGGCGRGRVVAGWARAALACPGRGGITAGGAVARGGDVAVRWPRRSALAGRRRRPPVATVRGTRRRAAGCGPPSRGDGGADRGPASAVVLRRRADAGGALGWPGSDTVAGTRARRAAPGADATRPAAGRGSASLAGQPARPVRPRRIRRRTGTRLRRRPARRADAGTRDLAARPAPGPVPGWRRPGDVLAFAPGRAATGAAGPACRAVLPQPAPPHHRARTPDNAVAVPWRSRPAPALAPPQLRRTARASLSRLHGRSGCLAGGAGAGRRARLPGAGARQLSPAPGLRRWRRRVAGRPGVGHPDGAPLVVQPRGDGAGGAGVDQRGRRCWLADASLAVAARGLAGGAPAPARGRALFRGQDPLPGHARPRDPHADDRCARHGRADAGRTADTAPARTAGSPAVRWPAPAAPGQRLPGPGPHRGRQAGTAA